MRRVMVRVLPVPGAGQNAHRPAGGQDGFALLVVEVTRDEFALAGRGCLDRHAVHLGRAL